MNQLINPPGTPATLAYSHGVLTTGGRTLHVSGQIGARADGTVPEDATAQMAVAWANLEAVLAAADMSVDDLVMVRTYLTAADDVPAFRTWRNATLGGRKPGSTLLVISALADPRYKVEIEAVAVR